tara:strand:+ start:304 stop:984 length:681 start_codon:yes stop_codon:yes gene_type:complete
MSSPFQQSFSLKSPFRKEGVVTLSEQDIKNAKSASSQPAKEISYEGQGGKDYENRPEDATNPEGQGGKDYEAEDSVAKMNYEEKKTDVSPLGNYANPRGEQYISNQPAMQQLQNDLQFLGDSIANESSANKAARLQGRVDSRNKRGARKNEVLRGDEFEGAEPGVTGTEGKTFDIQQRAIKAGENAISQAKAKAEANDNFNKWLNDPENSNASDAMIEEQKKLAGL